MTGLAGVADQARRALACRLRPAPLVVGDEPPGRRRASRPRRARVCSARDLGVDDGLGRRERSAGRPPRRLRPWPSSCSSSVVSAWSGSRRSRASRARSSTVCWWRRSCSTSACIAWSSRGDDTSPEYMRFSTALACSESDCGLVLVLALLTGQLVARAGQLGEPGPDAHAGGLGLGQRRPLGERRPPVAQPIEREVALLHDQQQLEGAHAPHPNARPVTPPLRVRRRWSPGWSRARSSPAQRSSPGWSSSAGSR